MSDLPGSPSSLRWPPRLLVPSLRVPTIYDIDRAWLASRNIRGIICDLDNTLVPWHDYRPQERLKKWFQSLHEDGFRTVILSNARPGARVEKLATELNTVVIAGAHKPGPRYFRQALQVLGTAPSATCVIGDQVFTDVLGGNLAGCHTVLVERIARREFIGTRLMRLLEGVVLRRLGPGGTSEKRISPGNISSERP